MSRQIQIRRGTAAEHENFTGAEGEITMDTTNKTLRVHDGETVGGTILAKKSEIPDLLDADYVVEKQLPTAENNYTWFRKYKSGWFEQGGYRITNGALATQITLPREMSNKNYAIFIQGQTGADGINSATWQIMPVNTTTSQKTTSSFYVQGSISGYDLGFYWRVEGL